MKLKTLLQENPVLSAGNWNLSAFFAEMQTAKWPISVYVQHMLHCVYIMQIVTWNPLDQLLPLSG